MTDETGKCFEGDPKILLDDTNVGQDNGVKSWYPQPHDIIKRRSDGKIFHGTFRSYKCNLETVNENEICSECASVTKMKSFKKRLKLRLSYNGEKRGDTIRFDYLSHQELLIKARHQSKTISNLNDELFLTKSTAARLRIRKKALAEKLAQFASTGDMKAVAHKLVTAANEGKLRKKNVLSGMIQTVAKNLHRQPQGRRFETSVQEFYEVILILGGPRLARFVAENLDGPGINTIYHWRQTNSLSLKTNLCESNISQFIELYEKFMKKHNISNRVPVLTAEDETAIKAVVSYGQEFDELIGFCGAKLADGTHECLLDKRIVIGDDEHSYDRLVKAFQENQVGGYARVILLNPLHPNLPRVVLWLTPTCNRFTHLDVERQWTTILTEYTKKLESVLGPLIGQSSDGDSRRSKLQMQNMLCDDQGGTFQPIPSHLGFFMSVKKRSLCRWTVRHSKSW